MAQIKTVNLTGAKTQVNFDRPFVYVECNNLGESEVLLSTKPNNIERGADDVIIIKAGSTATIGDLGVPTIRTVYLIGEGEVQLVGKGYVQSSFKRVAKGGGGNVQSNILPHSEGLTYFFDYQNGVSATGWKDLVQGYTLSGEMISGDNFASFAGEIFPDFNIKKSFTAYMIAKTEHVNNSFLGLYNENKSQKIEITSDANKNLQFIIFNSSYRSTITAENYNICAFTIFDNKVSYYINGNKLSTSTIRQDWFDVINMWTIYGNANSDALICYKSIAFFEDVAQNEDDIAENSQYLAQKYVINI